MKTWQEAVRGIVPWVSAWVYVEITSGNWSRSIVLDPWFNMSRKGAVWFDYYIDLADADTLAAFDRRLALRLGAPPDKQSFVVFGDRRIYVAVVAGFGVIDAKMVTMCMLPVDTDDPLLARALAWRSVS